MTGVYGDCIAIVNEGLVVQEGGPALEKGSAFLLAFAQPWKTTFEDQNLNVVRQMLLQPVNPVPFDSMILACVHLVQL